MLNQVNIFAFVETSIFLEIMEAGAFSTDRNKP